MVWSSWPEGCIRRVVRAPTLIGSAATRQLMPTKVGTLKFEMKAETLIERDSNQPLGDPVKSYLTRRRALIVISILFLALFGFTVAALSLGSERVAAGNLFPALISKLIGTDSPLSRE